VLTLTILQFTLALLKSHLPLCLITTLGVVVALGTSGGSLGVAVAHW
jgi:hypothetical protein